MQRRPKQLSGGQRQRVAIGRAIVRESQGVPVRRAAVQPRRGAARADAHRDRKRTAQRAQATMIYVTHDQVEAMTMADKIVVLNAGNIEQVGSPLELYHKPDNLFVAGFIGSPTMKREKG
jgi:multiple sugar transport system ATP-binding protein